MAADIETTSPAHADIERALASYSPADAVIATMRAEYMALKVHGIDDRQGLAEVHAARRDAMRPEIEQVLALAVTLDDLTIPRVSCSARDAAAAVRTIAQEMQP